MVLIEDIEKIEKPFQNAVLTIGNFDGVHIGHQALFHQVIEQAAALGGTSVAMTFEPHPLRVLKPNGHPPQITVNAQKLELIAATGIDVIICVPFTRAFAAIDARAFVSDILVRRIGMRAIVIGKDYTFGRNREGNIDMLRRMGRGMTGADVRRVVARVRERAPGVALRSEVMVGFPGETEEDFLELRTFVAETAFDRLGVFRFSPQEGTAAARLPDPVPEEAARERHQELITLQEGIVEERGNRLVGSRIEVMADGEDGDGLWTRSEADAPDIDGAVLLPGESAPPGTFLEVEITEAGGALLVARRRS